MAQVSPSWQHHRPFQPPNSLDNYFTTSPIAMEVHTASSRQEKWTKSSSSLTESHRMLRSLSFDEHPSNRRIRYDVTNTMDRLRADMVGEELSHHLEDEGDHLLPHEEQEELPTTTATSAPTQQLNPNRSSRMQASVLNCISRAAGQIPAILLIGMFHMMIGIPFGVSYFPIGWRANGSDEVAEDGDSDGINGPFPLPGKEALGIRMFLFSTIVGQIVFTLMSGFKNPIGLQMVENVPFCHELSRIVIQRQGYGTDALSTIFVLFGISSLLVGGIFYTLGRLQLGRVVYYFPTHVLVGCIGGIGLYIAKTGIEVTMDSVFSISAIRENVHLLLVVLVFEVVLRVLQRLTRNADGKPRYSLLSPIYFCCITPIFYAALWLFHVDLQYAKNAGYFFPSLDDCDDSLQDCSSSTSIIDEHTFDIGTVIDFSVVSWSAILSTIPTLVALILFSLIHVPINIPAFAISTNTEADMNRELVAHGYSNCLAGVFAGLQNYMAYTQSVLYYKSGGTGKASGMAVAALTTLLFFIGPMIASYIPRCMAGTLLVHVGIDLFLEGVYDSYGKFDQLEYASIWIITVVMTIWGIDAAMLAGAVTAITTYLVQNTAYVAPVRGSMSAITLRSSQYNRGHKQQAILNDPVTGRGRILVVQLQGHLFFGNFAHLTTTISRILSESRGSGREPIIVIMDFSLVLGIDSSAAQAMAKLKSTMQKRFHVELSIFVSGSPDGFPCQFDLSKELSAPAIPSSLYRTVDEEAVSTETTSLLKMRRVSSHQAVAQLAFAGSHVCTTLDQALIFAENYLIHRQDASLLDDMTEPSSQLTLRQSSSLSEEKDMARKYLKDICPGKASDKDIEMLFSKFERQVFTKDEFLWKQGDPSNCAKLLVGGTLLATLDNEAGTRETVFSGNMLGEVGLIEGAPRMSSVRCLSEEAVLYSLDRASFERLAKSSPQAARLIDLICIRYLSARVQHVSNRIFETRCLPI